MWAGVADLKGGSMTVGESERSVWVRRLFLSCFRSYLTFDLSADRRPVVLTGPNGAGKTNLKRSPYWRRDKACGAPA